MPAQNSPKGLFAKDQVTAVQTLGLGNQTFTEDTTSGGVVFGSPASALPTHDGGAAFTVISNSTGVALAVNATGTTWLYLNTTSVQPTGA